MTEATLFAAALEKATDEERAAYLAEACAGDDKLRRRVEALLRAHAESDDLLDPPPSRDATADYAPITERPGTRIGRYRLMEQIGEGGFGLVFVAEQQEPVRRKVALKVIKPGMDSAQVIARFEAERQALALMDHPNIARVLDAGSTESGRPYFVMELVRGIPITDYGDQNQLTTRERLELFVTVCNAIQHAHQKGIIHRDIKPSNVLVTSHDGKPVAKVIDFGVAKAIYPHLTERTIYTQFAQMIGTPLYMSPEQAEMSGLDIDTRSDIYSLGVLLYELLTGTTPLEKKRFARAAYDEIRRLIREEEPPRPSQRLSKSDTLPSLAASHKTEPAKLARLLRGELDWIVMKALEKDRSRRYETANGLARDVQRYLADEAVEACPPSAGYKLRKFVRKNRTALMVAVTIALLLLAGAAVSTWQAVRATRAEAQATEAQAQAEADRERALAAERLASERLEQITKEKERAEKALADATSERGKADSERKRAMEMEALMSAIQSEQKGVYRMAEDLYLVALHSARERVGPGHFETFLSVRALCDFYGRRKTPEKGEPLLRELRECLHRQHPEPDEEKIAIVLDALGLNLLQQQKWVDAEAVLREGLSFHEKQEERLRREVRGFPAISPFGNTRSLLGNSLVGQKRYAEAEPYLVQGYSELKQIGDMAGDVLKMILPLPEAVERLVQLYEAWDKPDEAARWRKELEAVKK